MQALGFIEVVGKVAAIEAADTCLKSANVNLIGYELTNGALITVKVEGDVGAVKSAIDAAKARDIVQDQLVAALVIPRPAKGISAMVESEPTKQVVSKTKVEDSENSYKNEGEMEFSNKVENNEEVLDPDEVNNNETSTCSERVNEDIFISEKKDNKDNNKDVEDVQEISTVIDIGMIKSGKVKAEIENSNDTDNTDNELVEENQQLEDKKEISCNLCHDPMCLRKRGQPKNLCMHYKDKMDNIGGDTSYEAK
ncbi:BMC domain-containing protein [Clostridium magnum]|uniref:Propanediol utilization protein PduA n=1 Tax=Clostridium magnum DSM 2767 TaxID=1121326 RepID=A0A162SBH0_9CLOT|nr:BMC domain-containing protein [Clostridium magnum]KZL91020.1 propanediol utilization protein PduA [Clostridium magnum DSM 2767]SHI65224.1 Carbon dioxide concentrating mechanism/carboxysome shell protein [Clostridium magnum DSM 2767]